MKLKDALASLGKGIRQLGSDALRGVYRSLRSTTTRRTGKFAKEGMSADVPEKIQNLGKPATEEEMRRAVGTMAGWLQSSMSTPSGYNAAYEAQAQSMRDRGIDIANGQELKDFGKFMQDIGARFGEVKGYDSETSVKLWNEAKRLGLNAKQFRRNYAFWANHVDDMEKMDRIERRGGQRDLKPSDYIRQLGYKSMKQALSSEGYDDID